MAELVKAFPSPLQSCAKSSILYQLRGHVRVSRGIGDKRLKVKLRNYSRMALATGLRTDTFVKRLGGAVQVDPSLSVDPGFPQLTLRSVSMFETKT